MLIHEKLIEEVLTKLRACKADFRIIMPDGTEYGNLEVVKLKAGSPRAERRNFSHLYMTEISKMEVADVIEFDAEALGVERQGLSNAIGAGMVRVFGVGAGKVVWNEKSQRIEVMRLK